MLDVRLLEMLESYCEGVKCRRIDASTEVLREGDSTESERATALFGGLSVEGLTLTVRCESLSEGAPPLVLTVNEEEARMREAMRFYAPDAPLMPVGATLVLNLDAPVTARLLDGGYGEEEGAVARHLLSLALLAYRPLSAEEMTALLAESYRLLGKML